MIIILYIILGILALVLAWLALLYISGRFVDPKKEYNKNSKFYRFLLNFSTKVVLFVSGVDTKVSGEELLPKEGRFLLVSNHRSNFDPLITWTALPKYDLAFISKPENFKLPLFGRIIRKCCYMAIDRKDPLKANTTKNRATKLIKSGEVSVAVYPEGTRSKSGKLLKFHNGLFYIAKEANVPIVVMTIKNTWDIKKNFPLKRTKIALDILDCISAEEVAELSPHDIGERARNAMLEHLGQNE